MSLERTSTVTGVSSSVVAESSTASGASFTGPTVMPTVASLESAVPSLALKVKLSEPL